MKDMNSMKILVVEPGKHPYEKEIKGELKEMQEIVGGTIQAVYPFPEKIGLVCNDEGIILGLPFNREIKEDYGIFGTFFISGLGSETFASLPKKLVDKYKRRFYSPQIYTTSGVYNVPPERCRMLMEKRGNVA